MTKTVADDSVLGKIARQQHDLFRRVREGSLDPQFVTQSIQEMLNNHPKRRLKINVDAEFPHQLNMLKRKGWQLVEDVSGPNGSMTIGLVEILLPEDEELPENLYDEATKIPYRNIVIYRRAKRLSLNLGQRHAEAILGTRGFQKFLCESSSDLCSQDNDAEIIFPGTKWRDESGEIFVPVIKDGGEGESIGQVRWTLDFMSLRESVLSFDLLARVL